MQVVGVVTVRKIQASGALAIDCYSLRYLPVSLLAFVDHWE